MKGNDAITIIVVVALVFICGLVLILNAVDKDVYRYTAFRQFPGDPIVSRVRSNAPTSPATGGAEPN